MTWHSLSWWSPSSTSTQPGSSVRAKSNPCVRPGGGSGDRTRATSRRTSTRVTTPSTRVSTHRGVAVPPVQVADLDVHVAHGWLVLEEGDRDQLAVLHGERDGPVSPPPLDDQPTVGRMRSARHDLGGEPGGHGEHALLVPQRHASVSHLLAPGSAEGVGAPGDPAHLFPLDARPSLSLAPAHGLLQQQDDLLHVPSGVRRRVERVGRVGELHTSQLRETRAGASGHLCSTVSQVASQRSPEIRRRASGSIPRPVRPSAPGSPPRGVRAGPRVRSAHLRTHTRWGPVRAGP